MMLVVMVCFHIFSFFFLINCDILEDDGKDEAICPADFRVKGVIVDDDLHDILVKNVPAGAQLVALMV